MCDKNKSIDAISILITTFLHFLAMIVRKTEYVLSVFTVLYSLVSCHFLPQANKVFYHKLILIILFFMHVKCKKTNLVYVVIQYLIF